MEKCAKAAFSAGTAKRWYLAPVTGSSGSVIGQREWFCLVCQMKGVAAFTVAIVSSHGQLAEGWFAPLDVFFFFFVVHTAMRFSCFERNREKLECMQLWMSFVAVGKWESGAFITDGKLTASAVFAFPPPSLLPSVR